MKKIYSLFILLLLVGSLRAQDKMIVDQNDLETSDYENSEHLKSLEELPPQIKKRLDRFLARTFGTFITDLKFSNGEIVDLKAYFENDTLSRDWVVPKYELNFSLQAINIGIKKYQVKLKLDEYGQILFANWPKEGFSDKDQIPSRTEIEQATLKTAKIKSFDLTNYEVSFAYNEKVGALCWIFKFPVEIGSDYLKYDVLEIDWKTGDIIFEGQSVSIPID